MQRKFAHDRMQKCLLCKALLPDPIPTPALPEVEMMQILGHPVSKCATSTQCLEQRQFLQRPSQDLIPPLSFGHPLGGQGPPSGHRGGGLIGFVGPFHWPNVRCFLKSQAPPPLSWPVVWTSQDGGRGDIGRGRGAHLYSHRRRHVLPPLQTPSSTRCCSRSPTPTSGPCPGLCCPSSSSTPRSMKSTGGASVSPPPPPFFAWAFCLVRVLSAVAACPCGCAHTASSRAYASA